MNARPTLPLLMMLAIATCAACDRRETTGTSEVHREGQGDTPETAQDVRETATPGVAPVPENPTTPAPEPSPERPVAPPIDEAARTQETQPRDDDGDTLGRP